jgi:hypothetical protein
MPKKNTGRKYSTSTPQREPALRRKAENLNTRINMDVLVDVAGIEPATPCLQSNGNALANPRTFNQPSKNSMIMRFSGLWLDVCRCDRLSVGSLQKSLQHILREVAA